MIKIENTNVCGWEAAIRGMRNPLNSWDNSDSFQCDGIGRYFEECPNVIGENKRGADCDHDGRFVIGENDLKLMKQLIKAGSDHSKFMRMIDVSCDIIAPLYWWKEFDTYKVGTVRNSCSTMHTIHKKPFGIDDFSHEHCPAFLCSVMEMLNVWRNLYIETNDKKYWYAMIQLLPSSYNQRATVRLNYAVLRNMYYSRKNHKLDEWRVFCEWSESLPHSELITGGVEQCQN